MNFIQIQYFMTLAEELSFSKAAEKLYVTQPNVSMQISSLEKEWGMKLFFRRYRSVALTPAGHIMYKTIKEASALFEAGLERAHLHEGKENIPVIIGVPEYGNLGNMPDLLAVFQKSHSEFRLSIESSPESQLILRNANGRYDIVLNQLFMLDNTKELRTRLFSKIRFSIVISRDHPLLSGVSDPDFSLLRDCEMNVYIPTAEESDRLSEHCSHICKSCGFTPKEIILTPNVNSALISAKMKLGIAVLDEMVLNPDPANLVFIHTPVETDMVLAWRKDNEKDCLEEMVDLVCDSFAFNESFDPA